jgi:hypothetical protein
MSISSKRSRILFIQGSAIHCEHLAHAFHEDPCGDCVGFKIRLKSFKEVK